MAAPVEMSTRPYSGTGGRSSEGGGVGVVSVGVCTYVRTYAYE